jgi:hypothetical protein
MLNPATLTVEAGHFASFSVFIAKSAICFGYVKLKYNELYAVSVSMYDCRSGRFQKPFLNYYHYYQRTTGHVILTHEELLCHTFVLHSLMGFYL